MAEWRLGAGELLREHDLDRLTLTNNLPFLVAAITRELAVRGGAAAPPESAAPDNSPHHGVMRFREGVDVGEVVAEYNLLRTAFTTVAKREGCVILDAGERIINHGIDKAAREAVMAFANQQTLQLKAQHDEHYAFIAHDLRTPLNAVSMLVEELKHADHQQEHPGSGEIFDILKRNLQRVEDLIQRALDAQRQPLGAGGPVQVQRRTFELWPVVQRLMLDLQPVSAEQAVEVVNAVPPALEAFADAYLIGQVFQNLLCNAFKYAPGGRVVVSASADDAGAVTCVVADNGAGIAPGLLARVFDKGATDPVRQGGTGFGLAIVKRLVGAHGGRVGVDSLPGAGATFTFSLPPPCES